MSEKEVTIKVVPFTSASNWSNWKELFLARVRRKDAKLAEVFDLTMEFSLTKTVDGKKIPDEEHVKAMASAYNELLLSMSLETQDGTNGFNLVKWSKDGKGNGDAREAWKRLIERYEPKTYLEKGKLLKKFYSAVCNIRDDPVSFVYKLEDLRGKIHTITEGKEVISDKDFMHQVLNCLPSAYESLVENLQPLIDQEKDPITIVNLIQELGDKFAKMKTVRKDNRNGPEEMALVGFSAQFKGKCNYCGKIGHKGVDCCEKNKDKRKPPPQAQAKKGNFVPKCYNCGEIGHKRPDCPKLAKKKENLILYIATDEVAFTALVID